MKSPFSKNAGPNVEFAYFGKLPKFGDFVRFNASRPEMKTFDEWLQEGLLHTKKTLSSNFDRSFDRLSLGFVYPYEDTGTVLVGGMIASTDKVGRHYPFYAAVIHNISAYPEDEELFFPPITERFLEYVFPFMESASDYDSAARIEQEYSVLQEFVVSGDDDDTQAMAQFANGEQVNEQNSPLPELDGSGIGYQMSIPTGQPEYVDPILHQLSTGDAPPFLFWHMRIPGPFLYIFGAKPSPKIWGSIIDAGVECEFIRKFTPDAAADFE